MKRESRQFLLSMLMALAVGIVGRCAPAAPADLVGEQSKDYVEAAPDELKNINVTEHRGSPIPLDLEFQDDHGKTVQLGQYFTGKKPVVLQLGYFGCPMLCGLITRGVVTSLEDISLTAGKDFELLFISIDPNETSGLGAEKKKSYVTEYDRAGAADGFHFLVGKPREIKLLTQAVGFNYKWVESARQFSHPSALMILTPDGKLSRYLYGVKFDPRTVRLSLVEASDGKIGSAMDQIFLTCFHYDGTQGKYALAAISLMRMGGVVTIFVMTIVMVTLFRRGSKHEAADENLTN